MNDAPDIVASNGSPSAGLVKGLFSTSEMIGSGGDIATIFKIMRNLKPGAMLELLGKITGAISILDDFREGFEEFEKGEYLAGSIHFAEGLGQFGFMAFGGEEAEVIYNIATFFINATIDYYKGRDK
jgi:hypothetical protein